MGEVRKRGAADIAKVIEAELTQMMGPTASGPYIKISIARCAGWITNDGIPFAVADGSERASLAGRGQKRNSIVDVAIVRWLG
jgi:hypothetical protein